MYYYDRSPVRHDRIPTIVFLVAFILQECVPAAVDNGPTSTVQETVTIVRGAAADDGHAVRDADRVASALTAGGDKANQYRSELVKVSNEMCKSIKRLSLLAADVTLAGVGRVTAITGKMLTEAYRKLNAPVATAVHAVHAVTTGAENMLNGVVHELSESSRIVQERCNSFIVKKRNELDNGQTTVPDHAVTSSIAAETQTNAAPAES